MSKFTVFLRRERLYILLFVLVSLVSVLAMSVPPDKEKIERGRRAAEFVKYEQRLATDREAVEKVFAKNTYLYSMFTMVSLLSFILFLLGLVIDAFIMMSARAGRPLMVCTYPAGPVSWTAWDVVKVVILYMFFGYMILICEAFLAGVFPVIKASNFRMIFNSSVMDVIVIILILYFTISQYGQKPEALGLTVRNFFKNVRYGITAYVALIPVLFAIIGATAIVINLTKYVPKIQPVVGLFLEEKDTNVLLYTSIFASVAGPVIEELFFRGFMYNAVKKYTGVFWAIVVTASIFSLLHAHAVGFAPILAIGILLTYLYEKTGSLVPSVTVHIIHNLSMVVLVFLVKQLGVYG